MKQLVAPALEPVTLDQAKFAARLTGSTAFDAMIPLYIQAAREIAEMQTGQRFISQKWRYESYNWPMPDDVIEVGGDITAVDVSYWSAAGTWVTFTSSQFVWEDAEPGVRIAPPVSQSFPTLGDLALGGRVRVDITTGAATAAAVPAAAKTFIMSMVAYWIDNPQAYHDKPHAAAPAMLSMLDSLRVAF